MYINSLDEPNKGIVMPICNGAEADESNCIKSCAGFVAFVTMPYDNQVALEMFQATKSLFYLTLKNVALPKEPKKEQQYEERYYLNALTFDYYKKDDYFEKFTTDQFIQKTLRTTPNTKHLLVGNEVRIISAVFLKVSNREKNPDHLEDAIAFQLPDKIVIKSLISPFLVQIEKSNPSKSKTAQISLL